MIHRNSWIIWIIPIIRAKWHIQNRLSYGLRERVGIIQIFLKPCSIKVFEFLFYTVATLWLQFKIRMLFSLWQSISDCRKTVFLKSRETRFFSIFVCEIENFEKIEQKVGRIVVFELPHCQLFQIYYSVEKWINLKINRYNTL